MLSKQQLKTSHKQCIWHDILASNMCKIGELFSSMKLAPELACFEGLHVLSQTISFPGSISTFHSKFSRQNRRKMIRVSRLELIASREGFLEWIYAFKNLYKWIAERTSGFTVKGDRRGEAELVHVFLKQKPDRFRNVLNVSYRIFCYYFSYMVLCSCRGELWAFFAL